MKTLTLFNDNFALSPWRDLIDWEKPAEVMHPACDVEETDGHYVMSVDLPGVSKKDINIESREGRLVITAERKSQSKKRGVSERYFGKFERVATLPPGIDVDKIQAQYHDGVLTLAIPKSESTKARQIKISEIQAV